MFKCSPPSKSNVGIVGLHVLWMNIHQNCAGGGGGERRPKDQMLAKVQSVLRLLTSIIACLVCRKLRVRLESLKITHLITLSKDFLGKIRKWNTSTKTSDITSHN